VISQKASYIPSIGIEDASEEELRKIAAADL
jgi:hypothetical protein